MKDIEMFSISSSKPTLSFRAQHAIYKSGLVTAESVSDFDDWESLDNIGKKTAEEIRKWKIANGFSKIETIELYELMSQFC